VIDTRTNKVVATVPVGTAPTGVALAPDTKHAYIASAGSHDVSVLDTATNTVTASIAIPAGSSPTSVAVTPDGKAAYVAGGATNSVSVLETGTNRVVASVRSALNRSASPSRVTAGRSTSPTPDPTTSR
jgi:YVTN family beta-propeller protein